MDAHPAPISYLRQHQTEVSSRFGHTEGLAAADESLGEVERSARLIGAAQGLRLTVDEAPFYKDYKPNLSLRDRTTASLRSQLGKAAFEEYRAEGRVMNFEQAVAYTLEDNEVARTSSEQSKRW